jgi:hypothetical protein
MGRLILAVLGVLLAIWVAFMAIGWVFAMLKTFFIIGLVAVVIVMVSRCWPGAAAADRAAAH